MRKKTLLSLAFVVGILALSLPLVVAFRLAQEDGRNQANAYLESLALDVLRRSDATRAQIEMAIFELRSGSPQEPCSPEQLARMRVIVARASYLIGLGYLEDNNRLLCSTVAPFEAPVELGPADRINPSGVWSWGAVELPGVAGARFNINSRGEYAAIIAPQLVIDILEDDSTISLTQVGRDGVRIIRSRGQFKPEWLTGYEGKAMAFSDADHFVVVQPSRNQETEVIAAMTREQVDGMIADAAWRRLPVGLLVGLLLAALVLLFTRNRLSFKAELQTALNRNEFFLLYQPVIDLRTGRCVGAEALIRWNRSDGEVIRPMAFIPAAEENGLIQQVTASVMQMVARDATELIRNNPQTHIAINFSAEDLHSPQTEERLQALIRECGGASHNIVIEATERGLIAPEKARGILVTIREQGFKVAIDDFGTGNSSLSYLATYDLDFLKIDKSFVDALGEDTPSSQVAFHIIEIARSLGLQMIAEGVETERQRDILREAGVQFAQGWVFGRPMPMADLAEFMRERNAPQPA
jgi:sensor c-di-GMP phosphodiesterase-like protein